MVKIFIEAQKTTLCARQNTSVLLTNKKSAKISLKVKHFNKKGASQTDAPFANLRFVKTWNRQP